MVAFPKTNNVVPQPSGGTKVDTIDPNQSGGIGLPPYMQGQPPPPKSHPPPQVEQPWNNLKHILIIVVAIVGVLILSGFIVFLFVYTCRKQRKKKDEPCYGLAANSAHIPGVDLPLVVMPHNRSQAFPGTLNGKAFNDSSIYTSLPSEDEEEQSERAGAAGSDATYATTGPPPPPPMGGAACKKGFCAPERYLIPFSDCHFDSWRRLDNAGCGGVTHSIAHAVTAFLRLPRPTEERDANYCRRYNPAFPIVSLSRTGAGL